MLFSSWLQRLYKEAVLPIVKDATLVLLVTQQLDTGA